MVTGGRNNYDWSKLWDALDVFKPFSLIEGGATGWDEGAYRWAEYHPGTRLRTVRAPWEHMGNSAGMARNIYMLDQFMPDILIAGTGGRGTEGCMAAASARGVPILKLPEY